MPVIWRSQKTIRLTVIFGKIMAQDIQRRISTKLCIQTLCIQSLPIPFPPDDDTELSDDGPDCPNSATEKKLRT